MRTKSVIIGAGLVGVAGIAIAAHFKQQAADKVDNAENNDIFCPHSHDQTGILARADAVEHLAHMQDGPQSTFQGFNYALDGQ